MERLDSRHYRAILDFLEELDNPTDIRESPERLVENLRKLIPRDSDQHTSAHSASRAESITEETSEKKTACREESPLTPREMDVLTWVARGKTNKEIGLILGASHRTVQKHLEHIFAKLGVETRTAAAAILLRADFIADKPAS